MHPTNQRNKAASIYRQSGWGLTETILALGIISALGVASYLAYNHVSVKAQVKRERDNLRHLASAVDRSHGLLGHFSLVSTNRLLDENLVPTRMRDGASLRTAWGSSATVYPHTVNAAAGTHNAFLVSYPDAPAEVCAGLASAMGKDAYDIVVGGRTVYTDGKVDPARVGEQCGSFKEADMEFVFHSGLVSGTAVAAPALVLPPTPPTLTPPPPTSPPVMTVPPVPGVPPVVPGTGPVLPPPAPGPALPPPVAPVPPAPVLGGNPPSSHPPPPPITPPGVMCAPPAPEQQTRRVACPASQYGQRNQERWRVWECPEAWDNPVGEWSAWSQTSTTCTACPAPAMEHDTQWVNASALCPAGQYGRRDWQKEQEKWREVSYTCPAGSWTLPDPYRTSWTPWSDTGATRNATGSCSTCPSPRVIDNQVRWASPYTQACPTGQLGTITREREQQRELTRSYTCPAGTITLPSPSDTWSGWSNTGNTRVVSNTCADECVLPTPATRTRAGAEQTRNLAQSQTVNQTQQLNCPAGQYGVVNQSRTATQTRQQPQSRTTTQTSTASCPAPTGAFVWSSWSAPGAPYGTWTNNGPASAWSAPTAPFGAWSTTSNTCTGCPAPSTTTESQWRARSAPCPSGTTGTWTWEERQQRSRTTSYSCPAGTRTLPPASVSTGSWSWTGQRRAENSACAPDVSCSWQTVVYSLAPSWGNTDGESIDYNNGSGGGCSASKGALGNHGNFSACWASIPSNPPPGASYFHVEYSNYGGGMTNQFGYEAKCE